jgi:type IV pilus assembly protein PilQ
MTAGRRIPAVLVAISLAAVLLVPAAPAAAQGVLLDVTVTSQSDALNIFVKTSTEPKYHAELIASPRRLVIDLEDTVYAWRRVPLTVGIDPVAQIRGSQYRKGVTRIVFDLTHDVGYAIREDEDGLAIVIPTAPGASRAMAMNAGAPPATAAAPAKTDAAAPRPGPTRIAQAPPAPAAPAAPERPSNGSRLISFDFKDADVVNLLRILAAESTKNIVIGDDVKGKMSISLRNVPWDLAFQTILDTRGLQKIEKDGVIRIVSNDQLLKEREAQARVEESKLKAETEIRAKAAEAKLKEQEAIARERAVEAELAQLKARGPLKEESIRLAYADPEDIEKTLLGILGQLPAGIAPTVPSGPPPIAAPPFSALYGTAQAPGAPAPTPTPTAEVLAKGITIRAHKPTNSIFIRHYEADLERIKKLIREKLDVPLPQVKIEARLNELNRTDFFALGVSWGGAAVRRLTTGGDVLVGQGVSGQRNTSATIPPIIPPSGGIPPVFFGDPANNPALTLANVLPVSATTGLPLGGNIVNFPILPGTFGTPASIAFGLISRKLNINLVLDALEAENKTTSLSKPEVVTTENAKATISLGAEIPYATVSSAGTQVQFKEALLKLEVTPTVIKESGEITRVKMVVNVENNSQGALVPTTGGTVPSINRRSATTQVVVKEGETLAIGGIRQRDVTESISKVPFFGDIPVLGLLFRSKSRTTDPNRELVVFITPYVLKLDVVQAPPAEQPKR